MASSTLDQLASNPSTNGSKQAVVCVFCGSSDGSSPIHLAAAEALGKALHAHNFKLVYGGGTTGLMGTVARTLVSLSGPDAVHGIIPRPLLKYEAGVTPDLSNADAAAAVQIDHSLYGRTTVVDDMHTRKATMATEVSKGGPGSGFVALSGGFGTMEELMEITTWNQLGIHAMPVVTYNVNGYWDGLVKWINDAVAAGFISKPNGQIVQSGSTADEVIERLINYENSKGRLELQWSQT